MRTISLGYIVKKLKMKVKTLKIMFLKKTDFTHTLFDVYINMF